MVKSIEGVFAWSARFEIFLYNIRGLPVRKFFGAKRNPLRPSLYSLSFWGWVVSLSKSSGSEYTNRHISLLNKVKLDLYINIHRKENSIQIQLGTNEPQPQQHLRAAGPTQPTEIIFFLLPCRPERHLRENILTPLTGNRWPLHDFNPTPDCFLLWASSSWDTELQHEPPAGVESLILSWIIVHVRSAEERDS